MLIFLRKPKITWEILGPGSNKVAKKNLEIGNQCNHLKKHETSRHSPATFQPSGPFHFMHNALQLRPIPGPVVIAALLAVHRVGAPKHPRAARGVLQGYTMFQQGPHSFQEVAIFAISKIHITHINPTSYIKLVLADSSISTLYLAGSMFVLGWEGTSIWNLEPTNGQVDTYGVKHVKNQPPTGHQKMLHACSWNVWWNRLNPPSFIKAKVWSSAIVSSAVSSTVSAAGGALRELLQPMAQCSRSEAFQVGESRAWARASEKFRMARACSFAWIDAVHRSD